MSIPPVPLKPQRATNGASSLRLPSTPSEPLVCVKYRRLSAGEMQLIAGSDIAVQIMSNRLQIHIQRQTHWFQICSVMADWLEENISGLYLFERDDNTKCVYVGFPTEADMLLFKLRFDGMRLEGNLLLDR